MGKNLIRLTENDLCGIVNESVNNIISEVGRSPYTQKKYDQVTRDEIISNAKAEVDRLRAEISNLSKKIKVAQSPEAIEQLNRQRSTLYKLRNRAVAKVWNLSNERSMTQGAKERATIKRRNDRMRGNNMIRFSPEDVPTFTESYVRNIVKESINKTLKEGYLDDLHDYWGQEDEPNLICPYCESDNVQELIGKDGTWDGSCKCYDCGNVFDIDSARGNNYYESKNMNKNLIKLTESDFHSIIKESVNKILREMDLNPRMNMNSFDAHGRRLTSKSHTPNSSRRRQQNLGGVNINMDAVNKEIFPDETPQMAKDQLKRKLYGESVLNKIVSESINNVLKEIKGDIITCFGTREAITQGGYAGGGSLLGDGVIYLGVGHAPENSPYGNNLISVNVDVSNFYRARNAQEAIAIARDNQEGYSGVLYHSHHDGDVCAVFDQSCIIGKA